MNNDKTFKKSEEKEIGKGGEGTVRVNDLNYAVKYIPKNDLDSLYSAQNELLTHKNINSKYIISFIEYQETDKDYIIKMDYVENGSLSDFLKNNFDSLSWKKKIDISSNISEGLYDLHT